MTKTHAFFLSSFILLFGVGFGLLLAGLVLAPVEVSPDEAGDSFAPSTSIDATQFKAAILPALEDRFDASVTGYNPQLIMYVYPGMVPEDFQGVAAMVGQYEFTDGYLWYINRDSAAQKNDSISDAGFETLFRNVKTRLADKHVSSIESILVELSVPAKSDMPPATDTPGDSSPDAPVDSVACPMDALMCPDGSSVGRTGPNCEFAACPSTDGGAAVTCTPEQRNAEACIEIYAPVCASVAVQCITTPCDPVPKTYPNSCFACAEENVSSYTEGECAL